MPMDCLDNVNWGNCLWFEGGSEKRNVISGMISGFLVCKIYLLLHKSYLKVLFC